MDRSEGVERSEESPLAEQTDERAARADWRSSIVGSVGLMLLIGGWLAVSSSVLDYERPELPIICGIAIVVIALAQLLGGPGSRSLVLASAGAGAVTVVVAFAADETAGPTGNLAVMGLGVIVLSLIGLAAATESRTGSRP
jgi:hypothetical protein